MALVALVVPLAIYLIHWLFGTRRRARVSAVFLWADLPQARTGRSQRGAPPMSWLLLLQLLAATLGVFALARPALPAEPPHHVALILDASASMQATDVAPTRFEAARASALQRLTTLGPSTLVSVIRAGKTATLLASGPPGSVRPDVESARPGNGAPAIRDALALASTRIAATPERRGQIVLFSDIAWDTPDPVGPLAAPVEVVPTGGGSNNQAITRLVVRLDPNGPGQTAFVEVSNESDRPARTTIRLSADGAPFDERALDIAARHRTQLSIPLPADAHHVTAHLLGKDALPLDDTLQTVAPGGMPRAVDLLGHVTDGLERAIESIPTLHVRRGEAALPADLTVLANSLPPQLPPGPLLLVNPPASSGRLLGVGLGSGARLQIGHPLLDGLDLAALRDATPSVSGVPGWAHVVLGNQQGPLIMEGRLEGHPVVSLTFDPALTGLEKSLAFPLLISNATSFLLAEADTSTTPVTSDPFDPTESDIAPRPAPTFDPVADLTPAGAGVPLAEIWPWLAAAALGIVCAEWLVFARRG
ncbi:MAG TPA: VWA domain-containing protein [Chloroflexota bacterium]